MYLFEVKKPSESKGEWDLYKLVATIPASDAFQPLHEGRCALAKSWGDGSVGCRTSTPAV
ncbi:hypothetical protein AC629_28300 [Bradyrhizobium sp. NAS80.1]|nr:hypothetical protein AC629_28300 [Bradyrhizobium sp. NAS80.1]